MLLLRLSPQTSSGGLRTKHWENRFLILNG